MNKSQILIFLVILSFSSCKENSDSKNDASITDSYQPNAEFETLQSNFDKWWNYHNTNIHLSSNFIAINESSSEISKEEFLKQLTSGAYIALKLESNDPSRETYQLFKLDDKADKDIGETIKNVSVTDYNHFKMEGKKFPEFNLTAIDGNTYSNASTKGKMLLIKTWFINCKACIAEFPELNEFVDNNKNREDIIFLSLATDSKSDLEAFLNKKELKYEVVANQAKFIKDKLKLYTFPTHLVVDENGTILKVVNKASQLFSFLDVNDKPIDRRNQKMSSPLPPPLSPPPPN